MNMWRDLGRIVGAAMRSTHPLLSSNIVECVKTWLTVYPKIVQSSCKIVLSGIRPHIAWDNEMYSASERAISLCNFDVQRMGQLAKMMIYPVLDLMLAG